MFFVFVFVLFFGKLRGEQVKQISKLSYFHAFVNSTLHDLLYKMATTLICYAKEKMYSTLLLEIYLVFDNVCFPPAKISFLRFPSFSVQIKGPLH
jgi:hypothetical protein